jgi:hypothetical protein
MAMNGARLRKTKMLRFLLCVFLAAAVLRADDFWKSKPSSQWNLKQAMKLLEDSPWSRQEVQSVARPDPTPDSTLDISRGRSGVDGIDPSGDRQSRRIPMARDAMQNPKAPPSQSPLPVPSSGNYPIYLVRWESAAPVTEAFHRLEELGGHAASIYLSAPPRLPADRYVVTVKLFQPAASDKKPVSLVDPFGPLQDSKGDSRARLIVGDVAVPPAETERSGVGASEALHFYFPREAVGAPLFPPGRPASAVFEFRGEHLSLKTRFSLDAKTLR